MYANGGVDSEMRVADFKHTHKEKRSEQLQDYTVSRRMRLMQLPTLLLSPSFFSA